MTRSFYPLTVLDTRSEIGGLAKSVMFDIPESLIRKFQWRPGQHLSLRFNIDGEEVRRSYSISSSPDSGEPLRITVKRVRDGLISNHINDHVKQGDVVDVMPPFGSFFLDTNQTQRRTYYFFAAGSGITPLHAMIRSVLDAEPHSVAHLVYGNATKDSVLFYAEIAQYARDYPERFSVKHVFSNASLWSSTPCWRKGKIDKEAIQAAIDESPPYAQDVQYFVCGPGGMNVAVSTALQSLDVPMSRIHMESFGSNTQPDTTVEGVAASVRIHQRGQVHEIEIKKGETILEAARGANIDPPFSCQSGVCGACRGTLSVGTVHMRSTMALDEKEIAAGQILTCQAVATSNGLELTYGDS